VLRDVSLHVAHAIEIDEGRTGRIGGAASDDARRREPVDRGLGPGGGRDQESERDRAQ
jgi:hypothetical protein